MTERFSDRIGVTQPRRALQVNDVDDDLRTALWNWVLWIMNDPVDHWLSLVKDRMWDEFFHWPVDDIPPARGGVQYLVKEEFLRMPWYEAYNFVEYILGRVPDLHGSQGARNAERRLNQSLERERSAFRSIERRLVPITSEAELDSVAEAATPTAGYEVVATHIQEAIALLSKKPQPDYRNSIKESISAVESAAKIIAGNGSAGIDGALAAIPGLHGSLRSAIAKFYGHASDEGGIRHALKNESTVAFNEAKLMLVSCSAIATFLVAQHLSRIGPAS